MTTILTNGKTIPLTDIKEGDTFRFGGTVYVSTGPTGMLGGNVVIPAKRENEAMPSGWELANLMEPPTATCTICTRTNIKGLPEGHTYFTEKGYSQAYPWVEVRRTDKTVTLHKVNVQADPMWKPKIAPGGFAGHCENQSEQTWLFGGIDAEREITIRMTKRGWERRGAMFIENVAREFYDYNF
ncbi:hypothetical protein [Paracoccus sp. MKU1]|uniref:hypothetical protein n=1 Tax=Paracoccus sp. MKU1 TaxID=1745182 RepID=UPI00071927B8|nr:hypothetical protein [Paracoccus sp. MKU1]KRW94293.1 hypothetical protein AQY21_20400 [Paracoccus sp. MKU1]